MYQKESQKIRFCATDFVKNEQRRLLSQGMTIALMAFGILIFAAIWTALIISTFSEFLFAFWLFLLAIALLFWGIGAGLAYVVLKTYLPLFCLLCGKYTLEIDRVQRIELRSERNYSYKRTLIGKLNKSDYITWQYVHFEKCGEFKTRPETEITQNAAYYVLVALTKKPTVINIRSCEKYELSDR